MTQLLRELIRVQPTAAPASPPEGGTFDAGTKKSSDAGTCDSGSPAAVFAGQYQAINAVSRVIEWAETQPEFLGAGETMADRLQALLIGDADGNQDGELTDDEQQAANDALNVAYDYLLSLGVAEADAMALLNDVDDTVSERVRELLVSVLPDGDEAAMEAVDDFVFGSEAEQATFDAAYKKVAAWRDGQKTTINKRISGTVHRSAEQKAALEKARRKANSAGAIAKRMRSMKRRNG